MTNATDILVADEEQLVEVATRIREIMRSHSLARTLRIGQLVLERFYGGEEGEWRARRVKKNNSIRALAARPDCPLGKSALNQAVAVYVASRSLPMLADARHIGAAHLAVVLQLTQPEREYWLQCAETEELSVRRLRDLVVSHRRAEGERRGRPELSAVSRVASRVNQSLRLLRRGLQELGGEAADGDLSELEALRAKLYEVIGVCERALGSNEPRPASFVERARLDSRGQTVGPRLAKGGVVPLGTWQSGARSNVRFGLPQFGERQEPD